MPISLQGYGFVAFVNKAHAEKAIKEMNKAVLAGREIRTNWATSKRLPQTQQSDPKAVAKAASEYNTTVYVGGLDKLKVNERLLRETFTKFGSIDGKLGTFFLKVSYSQKFVSLKKRDTVLSSFKRMKPQHKQFARWQGPLWMVARYFSGWKFQVFKIF